MGHPSNYNRFYRRFLIMVPYRSKPTTAILKLWNSTERFRKAFIALQIKKPKSESKENGLRYPIRKWTVASRSIRSEKPLAASRCQKSNRATCLSSVIEAFEF